MVWRFACPTSPVFPGGISSNGPQSRGFPLKPGGVEWEVTFPSPLEPGALRRQSMPLSYVSTRARSIDGHGHQVSISLDISGEWAHGDTSTPVGWAGQQSNGMVNLSIAPSSPSVLAE